MASASQTGFLSDRDLAGSTDYKRRVDPEGRFSKTAAARRRHPADPEANAYAPSFGLMGHESLIMQAERHRPDRRFGQDCLRCGKCKPVCATRAARQPAVQPAQQDPRHLAAVEAFLYEEQTRRGISIKHWQEFEDVADHCTVCHKCLAPCR